MDTRLNAESDALERQARSIEEQKLHDEEKFAELLEFFFTKMMVCVNEKSGELEDYLEPKNKEVDQGLELYYQQSESLSAKLAAFKKILKDHQSH